MMAGDNKVNIGTLEKFEWKVAMGISSSNCKNLDAPVITVVMTIKDGGGKSVKRSMEMNLEEFQVGISPVFFKQFKCV